MEYLPMNTSDVNFAHFFDYSAIEHRFDAAIDSIIKLIAVVKNENTVRWNITCPVGALRGGRPSAEQANLQRADDTSSILRVDFARALRIEVDQPTPQLIEV